MTTKKKPASDPLVAAETILIEGKAFERGERITGVSKDQIDIAAVQRRVIRKSAFDALGVPAPEFVSEEPEGEEEPEGNPGGSGE
ncbi:hypothetical protein [Rhizorhabdus sp.]|uniref:hypothetical protein n=1 Tax=Rhizorhabdus sp. TaxID=1968843 RepID=UPI0019C70EF0|nr:hypothetical protein [Rhizorhabdus sp.]MBD3762428.1 hypothetical protein [Rhizorhabdus sp.]